MKGPRGMGCRDVSCVCTRSGYQSSILRQEAVTANSVHITYPLCSVDDTDQVQSCAGECAAAMHCGKDVLELLDHGPAVAGTSMNR